MIFAPAGEGRDWDALNRALDRVKSKVFMGNDAAFFGPLMSSMNFIWSTEVDTAATDGITIWWNPDFFEEAPTKYQSKFFNEFVLRHELFHPGLLHMLRAGTRCHDVWGIATDIRINNYLQTLFQKENPKETGYFWGTFPACHGVFFDTPKIWAEEEIYDFLKKPGGGGAAGVNYTGNPNAWGNGDIQMPDPAQSGSKNQDAKILNNVVRAMTNAKMEGKPGAIPGNLTQIVDKFLTPIVPWEQLLRQWFTELQDFDYTWARPNRRYTDMYLPSPTQDDGKLAHLMYFQDVSGSITDNDIQRFNSELKFVWEEFKPLKMTIVQFDTRITKIDELKEGDSFTCIEIVGRGGTCLVPVRKMIIEQKPTAAIIFSDMQVAPMEPLPFEIPILWIATNAAGATVPFGKIVHIKV